LLGRHEGLAQERFIRLGLASALAISDGSNALNAADTFGAMMSDPLGASITVVVTAAAHALPLADGISSAEPQHEREYGDANE
jgi:hypothetical protein